MAAYETVSLFSQLRPQLPIYSHYFAPVSGAKCCDERVCLSVSLLTYLKSRTSSPRRRLDLL